MLPQVSPEGTGAQAVQGMPAVSTRVPLEGLGIKQQMRLLAVQLAAQLSGGGLSVLEFREYVSAIEKFIDKGVIR